MEIFKRKGNYSGAYLNDVLTVFKQNLKSCAGLQKAVTKRWYLVLLSRDHFQVRFRREPCTDHGHNRVMFPHFSAKTLKLIIVGFQLCRQNNRKNQHFIRLGIRLFLTGSATILPKHSRTFHQFQGMNKAVRCFPGNKSSLLNYRIVRITL